MHHRTSLIALALFGASACAPPPGIDGVPFFDPLPEGVANLADPTQDLTQVILRTDDNCFWYNYAGPVETTLLPLRAKNGRPICAPKPETPAES